MTRAIIGVVSTIGLCFVAGFVATLAFERLHAAHVVTDGPAMRKVDASPAWWNRRLTIGNPKAKFRITEFSDFQCPFCARTGAVLDSLRALHGDSITINYLHFPLVDVHPSAWRAAVVAECAGRIGQFETAYRQLFKSQSMLDSLSTERLYSEATGLSVLTPPPCVTDTATTTIVRRDLEEAARLALRGTPAIVVGHTLIEGAPSLRVLDSVFIAERQYTAVASTR